MKITFASIVLNESAMLGRNIAQHQNWCDEWIIVEGADRRWPADKCSPEGLSNDGTTDALRCLSVDPKFQIVHHGWAGDKAELRARYASQIDHDGLVVVIDMDEFLTSASWEMLRMYLTGLKTPGTVRIPHVHFWKHDKQVITGGYYDVPHNRAYRWVSGATYHRNHNHPEIGGKYLHEMGLVDIRRQYLDASLVRDALHLPAEWSPVSHRPPYWLHYGFCKTAESIAAKNEFYVNRGEASSRPITTRDRAGWFGQDAPFGCKVQPWAGRRLSDEQGAGDA